MKHRTIVHLESASIKVIQTGKHSFTVIYGKQVTKGLDYGQASREFGECFFHALACAGAFQEY